MTNNTRILAPGRNSDATFSEIKDQRIEEVKFIASTPKSFIDIFGDLSSREFDDPLELNDLDISSLRGVPTRIVGRFQIDFAKSLKDLEDCPKAVNNFFSVEASDNLATLKGITDLEISTKSGDNGILYLGDNPKLTDISDLSQKTLDMCKLIYLAGSPVLAADIVKVMSLKRKNNGSWSFLDSDHKESKLEKLYLVYEKLDFDSEKFDRALELL